ncbi:GNAT family N-acetyltransferase [Sphingobium sufflavum]|uniref:GNAT family N-acetyltransferase n=1 Tax=Sphingobium sufflavum TaxID=1129547 RepID=UPI001F29DFDB|nr:GNAT family N-acetyltransferase [Sphingobium sufflavum]MCE7795005.1 GNAT family N-acetyltransferase [Sphingobium sufflavum]
MTFTTVTTERLILRWWRPEDKADWFRLSGDPRVMATLGPVLDRAQSDAMVDLMVGYRQTHRFIFWAMERRADGRVIGFCGLKPGAEGTPIEGQVEIGWRLDADLWGQGYAREAAEASLDWGWRTLGVDSIWAITARSNSRSWGLMERLGMGRREDHDFDHPAVADGDPLKPHVTYAIGRPA